MTHDKKRLLSIGEAAKALEVTRRMILNYEDKWLILPDQRDGINGNRYYFYPDTAYRVSIPWYQGDWDDFHKVYIDSKPYYFGHDGELWRNRYVRSLGGIPGGYKSMDF